LIKVQLITGFLGAGKTTLIKKLLPEYVKRGKTVIIENDFGDANIDAQVLSKNGVKIKELNSGCICCSLFGDLLISLESVVEEIQPDCIIIEPSGLSCPGDVLKAVNTLSQKCLLAKNPLINIVDASNFKEYIDAFGFFYTDQIEQAGIILLSHHKDILEDEKDDIWNLIGNINPNALKINNNWIDMPDDDLADLLFTAAATLEMKDTPISELMTEDERHMRITDNHFANNYFASWSRELSGFVNHAELSCRLEKMKGGSYGRILRAKGFCRSGENTYLHFEFTPQHQNIDVIENITGTKVMIIGQSLLEEKLAELWQ